MTHFWGWMLDEDIHVFLELGERVSLCFWASEHLGRRNREAQSE